FSASTDEMYVAALSPDGCTLATADADGAILVWNLSHIEDESRKAESARDFESLWKSLGSSSAPAAYRALQALIESGNQSVSALKASLLPTSGDAGVVSRLVAGLEDDDVVVREDAAGRLQALVHVPETWKALARSTSREAITVLERLRLNEASPIARTSDATRRSRAVQVLERIGTLEAKRVLREVANGPPEARQTREARSAPNRIPRRVY
ncbi:MAG: hypothetical protein ACRD2L_03655, partial [Terriglobia bacterium]